MFLELTGGGEAAGDDAVVDGGKVGWAFLKLASTGDEEIFSRKRLGEVGYEESCHREVEGENWLNPVHHVIRRKAGRLASSGAVSPESERRERQPVRMIAFARLEDGIADSMMLPLNDAIGLQVVCRNADVSDAIPVRKPVESRHISGAVVGDDLLYCAPSAQYLLEYKRADHPASLHA